MFFQEEVNVFAEYGVLNYWTYLVGAIFIVLVPGPNTIFVLKNSVGRGVKGGYLAASGVFIGDAVLMFLAYAGVAALIKTIGTKNSATLIFTRSPASIDDQIRNSV